LATNKNAQLRYSILDNCFSNHYVQYTYDDLLENVNNKLEEYGYSIKIRQLKLDIEHMKSIYDFDLSEGSKSNKWTKRSKKTFRYADKDFSIYKKPITEIESQELKECLNTLNRIKGLPNFEWVNDMILKIDSTVNIDDPNKNIIGFEQNIYLKNINYLTDLYFKILEKKVLKLEYTPFDRVSELLICHPYYLKQYNNRWFLIANCENHKIDVSIFPLDRITGFKEIGSNYIESDIDFNEYFEDVLGVSVPDGKIQEIKLKVHSSQWNYIKTKPIHGSQGSNVEVFDDYVIVTLKLIINYEIENHIMQYGEKVEVLSPSDFRTRIANRVKNMHLNYTI
jgi:hypothetical protein